MEKIKCTHIIIIDTAFTVHGKDDILEIIEWLDTLPDNLDLCIGGPRESECWNAYEVAKEILEVVFGKE